MAFASSSGGRLVAVLVDELVGGLTHPVDGLDHVDRDADGAGLIRDGAGDGLTDPPRCVGGEAEAAVAVELLGGLDQADVALLNQVEEGAGCGRRASWRWRPPDGGLLRSGCGGRSGRRGGSSAAPDGALRSGGRSRFFLCLFLRSLLPRRPRRASHCRPRRGPRCSSGCSRLLRTRSGRCSS